MQKPIYLDYNSTSPTDPRVIECMLPYLTENFGNPANTLHAYGWTAEQAVQRANQQISDLIHCQPHEVVWTSGATEGNNATIFGLVRKLKAENPDEKIHIITSNAEHWSVLSTCEAVEKYEQVEVSYVPVNHEGLVTLAELKKHIRPETKLVSLIWVNNEIGSINPITELATYCHQNKIYFHTDATQAVGKIEVNLKNTPVHFLTFSAHKFYGPKGIGALVIRNGLEIEAFIVGGGQQKNRRSGTLNVPAIVGAGKAAELCAEELATGLSHTRTLLESFWQHLQTNLPGTKLNGPAVQQRSPVNLSLLMPQMIDLYLPKLSPIAFSKGSACQTGEASTSHVLKAIGLTPFQAQCTIRLSIGRFTTQDELEAALKVILNTFRVENSHSPNVTN